MVNATRLIPVRIDIGLLLASVELTLIWRMLLDFKSPIYCVLNAIITVVFFFSPTDMIVNNVPILLLMTSLIELWV